MSPEQEHEQEARQECARRGINPDELCADGGIEAWMIVDKELCERGTPMQRLLNAAGWDAGSPRHKQLQDALDGAGLQLVPR